MPKKKDDQSQEDAELQMVDELDAQIEAEAKRKKTKEEILKAALEKWTPAELLANKHLGPGIVGDEMYEACQAYDAQTSGGLLVALPAESAEAYAAKCREGGAVSAAVVGRVVEAGNKRLRVTK